MTIIWVLILAKQVSFAQTLIVKDQDSGENLAYVSVSSQQLNDILITDEFGSADVYSFKMATDIEIRALGYETLSTNYNQLELANFKVYLKKTGLQLDEIVVSGTRWKQGSGNVPAKIISISPQDVEFQNPQTAADMLNISGKVYIQKSQQGGGSPMIRGFATNRLLYSVDGVRMNTAIFRGGNLQNVINLDPFSIAHTEILFGPGSVLYGSDAIGGVMSFETLKPRLASSGKSDLSAHALIRYASANHEKTAHIDYNIGRAKWAYSGSFSHWDFNDLKQGSHGPEEYIKEFYVAQINGKDSVIIQSDPLLQIPSAYKQWNTMHKVRFAPNESWDLEYAFHFSETSSYGRYDRHNRVKNGTARYAEWDYGPQKWSMHFLSIHHESEYLLYNKMDMRVAFQQFGESRIDRTLNKPERFTATENVDAYSVNLDLVRNISSAHSLYYGAEYVLDNVLSEGQVEDIESNEIKTGPSRYPESQWSSLGIYINDAFQAGKKWHIQGGIRYNRQNLKADFSNNLPFYTLPFDDARNSNSALTGSIGAVFRPSETLVFRANTGTAFRAPNVDDIGKIFDSEPGAITVPNPELKAEYAYNIDLSIARIILEKLKIDVSAYYTILTNALVRRDFTLNGQDSIVYDGVLSQVQAIQNAAKANIYGIQAGFEWKLLKDLQLSSDINFQTGQEELDDGSTSPSRHAAPLFGITRLAYKKGPFRTMVYCQYQGTRKFEDLAIEERSKDEIYAKDAEGRNYAPGWYSLNAKISYDYKDIFVCTAGIENITDQRYRPYSSGISGAGINYIASVAYTIK